MEKILIIGANDFKKKKEALGYIASELDFPSSFGGNLDALFDCLCDIENKVNIAIDPAVVDESPNWYEALYETIVDASHENENIHLYFPAITD